jgi:hypothetical protein
MAVRVPPFELYFEILPRPAGCKKLHGSLYRIRVGTIESFIGSIKKPKH